LFRNAKDGGGKMATRSQKGQSLIEILVFLFLFAAFLGIEIPDYFKRYNAAIEKAGLTKEFR
jgi:competence protein ComGC